MFLGLSSFRIMKLYREKIKYPVNLKLLQNLRLTFHSSPDELFTYLRASPFIIKTPYIISWERGT